MGTAGMFGFIVTKRTDFGTLLLLGFSRSEMSSNPQQCRPSTRIGRPWLPSYWRQTLDCPMHISGLLNWTMEWSMASYALNANERCCFTLLGTWAWIVQRGRPLEFSKLSCATFQRLHHFCLRRTKSLVINDGQNVHKVRMHLTNRGHVLWIARENR